MIRVLQFTNAVARGGAEEHILHIVNKLDRSAFKVYLACTNSLADRIESDLLDDVTLFRTDFEQPYHLRDALRFSSFLKREHIGIVHSHMFYSSFCASPVARLSGTPVVIETSHGREAWRKGLIKGSFFLDRVVARCVDRIIAVSGATREYLIATKGIPGRKIEVIFPGSNTSRFDPNHRPVDDPRSRLGIDLSDPVVSFVGRLEPQKGHRTLLDAVALVVRAVPNVRVICAGEGSLRAELEARAQELNLSRNVFFIGYPSDIRDCLAIADFTVLPSLYEGLPVTPIEALASGKTMVATAVDGTPEVIVDGQTGLLVPPQNPEALAAAMCRLLLDPPLRTRLAEEGRRRVVDTFSVERMLSRTEEFYLRHWRGTGVRSGAEVSAVVKAASN